MDLRGLERVPVWIRRVVLVGFVAAALAAVLPQPAGAAPKVTSAEQCRVFATAALVARALAVEGIEKGKGAAVMAQIFAPHDDDAARLLALVFEVAYQVSVPPGVYSGQFLGVCLRTNGDVDSIVGSDA